LSDALDADAIEANYDGGVLTQELRMAGQANLRRIEIGRSGGPKTSKGSRQEPSPRVHACAR
jgi:hypothetical protein